mmetsp:Transcript_21953/g.36765  ORF Transcript_21953/g.36765 Transcript_21953/m.36765 type:complete len:298 (-) Transcript_21953:121-1014(-)
MLYQGLWAGFLVFWLNLLATKFTRASFIVKHNGNEGSHAFVDYLGSCSKCAIIGDELFDWWSMADHLNKGYSRDTIVDSFLSGNDTDYLQLLDKAIRDTEYRNDLIRHHQLTVGLKASPRGVLLRMSGRGMCQLNNLNEVWFMVRTDLMRWAVSEYDTHVLLHNEHLQFGNESVSHHSIHMPDLMKIVKSKLQVYDDIVKDAHNVLLCGKKVKFVLYEYFEDVGPTCPGMNHSVKRVHSHRLSDFISNVHDLYQYFAMHQTDSFASKVDRSKLFQHEKFSIYKVGEVPGKRKKSKHK